MAIKVFSSKEKIGLAAKYFGILGKKEGLALQEMISQRRKEMEDEFVQRSKMMRGI